MLDLNAQLEPLQANIDALQPGPSRDALQSDLDLVKAVIDGLPGRIDEAVSWQDAREAGALRARRKLREAMCAAFKLPKPR
jgi:hypothetical protein